MVWTTRLSFYGDPGPCPVDDAPHTTCTSADYGAAGARRIVIQQLPCRDALLAETRPAISAPPVVVLQPTEVTTATYRRKGKR
jgi:hypothetical protein